MTASTKKSDTDKTPSDKKKNKTSDDAEIADKLSKAKSINKNIMKSTHPEEYKKQQEQEELRKKKEEEEKQKKALEEENYKKQVRDRMTQLQEEVNTGADEFIKTAQTLKDDTAKKTKVLKKMKKKMSRLQKKKNRLEKKKLKQATAQALV